MHVNLAKYFHINSMHSGNKCEQIWKDLFNYGFSLFCETQSSSESEPFQTTCIILSCVWGSRHWPFRFPNNPLGRDDVHSCQQQDGAVKALCIELSYMKSWLMYNWREELHDPSAPSLRTSKPRWNLHCDWSLITQGGHSANWPVNYSIKINYSWAIPL